MNPLPKVSYYISHPIQYFSPLFREMAKHFDLHVYYFSDASIKGNLDKGFGREVKWDIPLLDGYNYTFLKNLSTRRSMSNRLWDVINPGVIGSVAGGKSRIVMVNGWSYFSTLLAIVTAKIAGKKVWLRAENTLSMEKLKSNKLLFVKKILLKHLLFRMVHKFLYIGEESKSFFLFYGVKEAQLVYTPYAVDNEYFAAKYHELKERKSEILQSLGLPYGNKIILFTAKFIPVKRPLDLVKAFHQLDIDNVALVMVGDGALMPVIKEFVLSNNIRNVYLPGFINQSSISLYYSVADVFVLCSETEPWGLSVNEAMNFRLPVVVSDTVGSSANLVRSEKNGLIFKKGDITELASSLKYVLENESFSANAGEESASIINGYNYSVTVSNLLKAVNS